MIPENITREHILNAIQEIDGGIKVPYDREPHNYQIFYNRKTYPPKFIISLANRYPNGIELDSDEFSGGEETNRFLVNRGFEVAPINDELTRYDDMLKGYLGSKFKIDIDKIKRSWLQFRASGIKLYVNGSKIHEKSNAGWYDLEQDIYHDLIESASSYYAVVLDNPSRTFVIPANVIKDIFGREPTIRPTEDVKKKPRWMFTLQDSSQGFTLRVGGNEKSDFVVDN